MGALQVPLPETTIRQMALGGATTEIVNPEGGLDISKIHALLRCLLETADVSYISPAHRGAACNVLSTLFLRLEEADSDETRSLLWEQKLWRAGVKMFLARFEDTKPKPMKQLFGTLIAILKTRIKARALDECRSWLIDHLRFGLAEASQGSGPKACLYAMTIALSRGVVALHEIACQNGNPGAHGTYATMINSILPLAASDDLGPTLAALLAAILEAERKENGAFKEVPPSSLDLHAHDRVSPLLKHYAADAITRSNYRHYVLPALVTRDFASFEGVLKSLGIEAVFASRSIMLTPVLGADEEFLFASLLAGASRGFVAIDPTSIPPTFDHDHKILRLPLGPMIRYLRRSDDALRLSALELVTDSGSARLISPPILQVVLNILPDSLSDVDPEFRSEFLGLFSRLINRLRVSTSALLKNSSGLVEPYANFLRSIMRLLETELRPGASYQRHTSALACLITLARSGIDHQIHPQDWSKAAKTRPELGFEVKLFTSTTLRHILSLTADAFDDVRAQCMTLVSLLMKSESFSEAGREHVSMSSSLQDSLQEVERRAGQSGRADQADSTGRIRAALYSASSLECTSSIANAGGTGQALILEGLMTRYEEIIHLMGSDLTACSDGSLLLPTIISLRYIMDKTEPRDVEIGNLHLHAVLDRLHQCIKNTWSAVKPVLCNDAPEGYQIGDTVDEDQASEDKGLLSFSWRALKEASLLQRSLIRKCKHPQAKTAALLSFEQLTQLRHRGAFSTVAQTFALECTQLLEVFDDDMALLTFYDNVLDLVRSAASINTRRSAGLPAMLVGIVAASRSSLMVLSKAVGDLTAIIKQDLPDPSQDRKALPQVHALNCLREIFRNSKLGQVSESFIPDALQVAGECLTSSIWAMRNSGLMLFRSLIDRLIGTNEGYSTSHRSSRVPDLFNKFPILINLVVELMTGSIIDQDTPSRSQERVFPALQLLEVLPAPQNRKQEIERAVASLLPSPHWHVRDKAARVLAALTVSMPRITVSIDPDSRSFNTMHGYLLCYHHRLRCATIIEGEQQLMCSSLWRIATARTYPGTVRATAVDLLRQSCIAGMHREQRHNSPVQIIADSIDSESVSSLLQDASLASRHTHQPLDTSLVSALAQLTLYDWQEPLDWTSTAEMLCRLDTDACTAMLREARAIVHAAKIPTSVNKAFLSTALAVLQRIEGLCDTDLTISALYLMTDCLMESIAGNGEVPMLDALPDLSQLIDMAPSPLAHDAVLICGGVLVVILIAYSCQNPKQHFYVRSKWLTYLQEAASDDMPFDTRHAAVSALDIVWKYCGDGLYEIFLRPFFIDLAVLAYDMTNDDDEEIRAVAATICSRIARSSQSLTPLAAGIAMLRHVCGTFDSTSQIFRIALKKLGALEAVRPSLAKLARDDDVLFAKEKQNLYIDHAREARIWSHILMRRARRGLDGSVITSVSSWVQESLSALRNTAMTTNDGPFGWSSDPEIFVLGLRIVYLAECLLHWQRQYPDLQIRNGKIRRYLMVLVAAGQQRDMHPMLIDQAEKVLVRDIELGMERVARVCAHLKSRLRA